MEAVKYTPGPWTHATDVGQIGSIEFADGTVIAQAQQLPGDFDRSQRNANARLIAAAPELLEALNHAVDWLNAAGIAVTMPVQQQARAAIAKATGEQP